MRTIVNTIINLQY